MRMTVFLLALLLSSCVKAQSGILGVLTTTQPATLRERLGNGAVQLQASAAWEGGANGAVLEATILKDASDIKIYYTGTLTDQHHQIGVASTTNIEGSWTKYGTPLIGQGAGGAPSGRNASSSIVVKSGGTYYAYCLNGYGFPGDDRNVYLYTSTDGYTFSDGGKILDKAQIAGAIGFGNTAIVQDLSGSAVQIGGKYKMILEAANASNIWEIYLGEAASLSGPWTVVQKLTDLQIGSGNMYGGACVKYVNGTYHAFYHYGLNGNLPTSLAYATSSNGLNWAVQEQGFLRYSDADPTPPAPPDAANAPYPVTDQLADVWVEEIGGKVYLLAEFVENTSPIKSQIWMWTYNGTFAQMVSGLQKPVSWAGKTNVFVGNSITLGNAIPEGQAYRWPTLLTTTKGSTESNLGISGEVMQSGNTYVTVFDKTTIPAYNATTHLYLFIALGTNDIGHNTATMTPEGFATDYAAAVDYAKGTRGWPANRIVLLTPYYMNSAGYNLYVGQYGVTTAANATRHEAYVQKVKDIALTKGCKVADTYTYTKNLPGVDSYLSDGLHYNRAGNEQIAAYLASLSALNFD